MGLKMKVAVAVAIFAIASFAMVTKYRAEKAAAAAMQRQAEAQAEAAKRKQAESDAAAAKRQADEDDVVYSHMILREIGDCPLDDGSWGSCPPERRQCNQETKTERDACWEAIRTPAEKEAMMRKFDREQQQELQKTPQDRAREANSHFSRGTEEQTRNFAVGCPDGYTTDSNGTVHCNPKPVDVRVIP